MPWLPRLPRPKRSTPSASAETSTPSASAETAPPSETAEPVPPAPSSPAASTSAAPLPKARLRSRSEMPRSSLFPPSVTRWTFPCRRRCRSRKSARTTPRASSEELTERCLAALQPRGLNVCRQESDFLHSCSMPRAVSFQATSICRSCVPVSRMKGVL